MIRGLGNLGRTSYSAGNFLFQLDSDDDRDAAYLKSVAGGMVKGAILEEQAGPSSSQFKHLGAVEIEPIQLEIGMAMSRPILDWIAGSWKKQFTRKSGAIVHADYNGRCKFEQWFQNALISETKFPTLDGAANEPAYLNVTLNPEDVNLRPGDGRQVMGHVGVNQKKWLPSNFRIDIIGVDCSHVSRIDSFTVKQTIRPLYTGMSRFPELEPTGVEFSNLTLYLSEEYGDDFVRWYHEFVVSGGQDISHEREGYIEFLGPDNRTPIFQINLNRLGIHQVAVEKNEANTDSVKRLKVELYLESMELEYSPEFFR